jgi:hypothetical protein
MMKYPLSADCELDDTPLVEAGQSGGGHAFEPLVKRHWEAIYAFVSVNPDGVPIGLMGALPRARSTSRSGRTTVLRRVHV